MTKYVKLLGLIILYIIISNVGLEFLSNPSTIENIIGLLLLICPIWYVVSNNVISNIFKNKENEK